MKLNAYNKSSEMNVLIIVAFSILLILSGCGESSNIITMSSMSSISGFYEIEPVSFSFQ
jgi:hypothetical protein